MGIITGYARRTASLASAGGGGTANTIYTTNDVIVDNNRTVSVNGNGVGNTVGFSSLGGSDILRLRGDKTALFGTGSNSIKLDPYGVSSWAILQYLNAGSTYAYNCYDSSNAEIFRFSQSGQIYAVRPGGISSLMNYNSFVNFWASGTNSSIGFVQTNGSADTVYIGNDGGHGYIDVKNSSAVTKTRLAGNGNSYFINSMSLGTNTADASCLLDIVSTTKALGLPSMTTVQKNNIPSPRAGSVVFDTTLLALSVFDGTNWS
jgi:hypothetical protein